MKAIYGQEVAPGYADDYLARNAYDGQQTAEPVAPNRPDNLFEPAPGDYAAHGIFDDRAKSFSIQNHLNLSVYRNAIAFAGTVLVAGLFLLGLGNGSVE